MKSLYRVNICCQPDYGKKSLFSESYSAYWEEFFTKKLNLCKISNLAKSKGAYTIVLSTQTAFDHPYGECKGEVIV